MAQVNDAKATGSRIDRTLGRYRRICNQVTRCGDADRETLLENHRLSKCGYLAAGRG